MELKCILRDSGEATCQMHKIAIFHQLHQVIYSNWTFEKHDLILDIHAVGHGFIIFYIQYCLLRY